MQSILGDPAALLEKKMSGVYSGAYENSGEASGAQLILYQMGSFALTGLPLEKRLLYIERACNFFGNVFPF